MKQPIIIALLFLFFLNACSKKNPVTETPAINYSKVAIKKVTVLSYPLLDPSGSTWDYLIATDPDLIFDITQPNTTLFSLPLNNSKDNITPAQLPYFWANTNDVPFTTINNFAQPVTVNLYDYDTDPNDFMGSCTFNINDYIYGTEKYPATITKTNGEFSVKLDLTWIQ